jgi:mannitol/fructose-specific phosphotransferase system IIA component (Ntr-type)
MKLTDVLPTLQIIHRMRSRTMKSALRELLRRIASVYTAMAEEEVDELVDRLMEREELGSTALENGVAVPHVYHSRFHHLVAAFGTSPEGISFGVEEKTPVRALFLLLIPTDRTDIHMVAMSKLAPLIQDADFMPRLLACEEAEEIHGLFEKLERNDGDGTKG